MNGTQILILAVAVLVAATYLTGVHVLPTEACSAILGGFATAITVLIQKNTYTAAYHDAIKASMAPPPNDEEKHS